jgi:hypothetical protein
MAPLGPPVVRTQAGQFSLGGLYTWSENDVKVGGTEFTDVELAGGFGSIGLGLVSHNVEIRGLVGVGKVEDDLDSSDEEMAFGGGATLCQAINETLSMGLVAHVLYYNFDDSGIETDIYDVAAGYGVCCRIADVFFVYGGPMLQMYDGKQKVSGGPTSDIDDKIKLGGWLGGGMDVAERVSLVIESQLTKDSFGFAFGGALRF